MQLAPGIDLRLGLGLWNSRLATFVVEGAMWFAALVFYVRGTRASRRAGTYAFWIMIALLTAIWILSLGGDPPSSLGALAITNSVFMTIVAAWALWMDRARFSA
jgi:hypothetical protein